MNQPANIHEYKAQTGETWIEIAVAHASVIDYNKPTDPGYRGPYWDFVGYNIEEDRTIFSNAVAEYAQVEKGSDQAQLFEKIRPALIEVFTKPTAADYSGTSFRIRDTIPRNT